MSEWELGQVERDAILRRSILPLIFSTGAQPEPTPRLILIAGQPGSGRSRAVSRVSSEHRQYLSVINGDDMRAFHPHFTAATHRRSADASGGLAHATAGWVRDCIRHARERKHSLLLEGAFLDPKVAVGTAERFAGEGFETRIVVVASRRAESLLSVASLYLRDVHASAPAQLVSREVHDLAFEATRALVAAVEDSASVDRLTIPKRNGETAFDAHRDDGRDAFNGAGAALEAAQSARLSRFDATQWLSELHHVTEFAASRRDLPSGVTDLLVDLHDVALREVIPELHVPSDGKFTIAIEQKTVASLVALRRSLPREQAVDVAAPVVTSAGPEREGISR